MEFTSLKYSQFQYGDHDLQRVGVWELPDEATPVTNGYWIVYIHGGAWRDPAVLLPGFTASIHALLRSGPDATLNPLICGFASIDYRLSPHPDYPQDPSCTPTRSYRDARHPDHINDVRHALASLQQLYGFGGRYVLVGHSAGATLAYQLLMGSSALEAEMPQEDVALPGALIGISGIYELVGLNERHGDGYRGFISGAFGEKEDRWNDAMPACFQGDFKHAAGPVRALLAWSPQDSLVDEPEIEGMAKRLQHDGVTAQVIKTLTGEHDFVWQDGLQVAQLVEQALIALNV